jgi:hypothetical protein
MGGTIKRNVSHQKENIMRRLKYLLAILLMLIISGCNEVFTTRPIAQAETVGSERLIGQIDFSSLTEGYIQVSPDRKRAAWGAKMGNRWNVIVDGKEGKQYDEIITSTIIFDSSDSLHYLAREGSNIYLVETRIK